MILKDMFLIFILFSLFYILYLNSEQFKKETLVTFTLKLYVVIISIVSVFNLLNLLYPTLLPSDIYSKLNISGGASIANDYNFYCLFILFGLVVLNYKRRDNSLNFRVPRFLLIPLNLILILNILLAGSRRGIFALVIVFCLYLINSFTFKPGDFSFAHFFKKIIPFLLFLISFLLILLMVWYVLPKSKIYSTIFRYSQFVGIKDLKPVEIFFWRHDPRVPKDKNYLIDKNSFTTDYDFWKYTSITGTIHESISTPYGPGIKVQRTSGINSGFSLFYTGPKILYYSNHTYEISFKIKFLKGDFNSFNVGWYVDDGGRGIANTIALNKEIKSLNDGWYSCTSKYTFIDSYNGLMGFINSVTEQTTFIVSDFELKDLDHNSELPRYEFEYKGKKEISNWLASLNNKEVDTNLINNGDFQNDIGFWKKSSDSIDIKVVEVNSKKCALIRRGNGNGGGWSLFYSGRDIKFNANDQYQISFKLKLIDSKIIPFNVGFSVDEGAGLETHLKLMIDTLADGWLDVRANYIFKNDQTNLYFPINSQLDNSQFYITNIRLANISRIQYQEKPRYQSEVRNLNNLLFSDRTSRWNYGVDCWNTRFKWYNKLFGHGFDYMAWYGEKFMGDPVKYDWPHNPFISILLYSGILGLLFYFWLLVKVVTFYYKYRREYGIAFIGFLLTFFFTFFSGNSPFDPPVMGFFMLLPFFIQSVHKNVKHSS